MKPPTYRVELFKGKTLANGRHPVCLTVTYKGKVKRKSISSALDKEWDSKNDRIKPRSRKDWENDNFDIETEYTKHLPVFNALKQDLESFTVEKVFEAQKIKSPLFKHNALDLLAEIKERCTVLTYQTYNSRYKKIMNFSGEDDFRLSEVDDRWIRRFREYCRKEGNSKNTTNASLKLLIAVGNHSGIKINIPLSYDKPTKEKLTPEELLRFSEVKSTPGTHEWHTRNTWMLQFYLRGMRIGDALLIKKDNIKDGRLNYVSGKTGEDFSMKIIPPAQEIIDLYKNTPGPYLLPWIRATKNKEALAQEIKNRTAVINWHLKKIAEKAKPPITKNISTHIARHTFAAIADKKLNRDIKAIQSLLGHGSRKMTEIYLNDLRKTDELDDAADLIFG